MVKNQSFTTVFFYIAIVFNIGFNASAHTVSEDDGFVDLIIVKTLASDAISSRENATVLFETRDGTAQGKWFNYSLHNNCNKGYYYS